MKIPPTGYLTLALLCEEPACVIVWTFTGIFLVLLFGIDPVVAAMLWEN